ncbi:MAG: pyridoxal-phosphate dependent enzyme [Methylomicrobium sp.]
MHPELVKLENQFNRSILTKVVDPRLEPYRVEFWVKRDDLIDPVISGNKWRKLKYIIDHFLSVGATKMISMGGPYSNHLHALAYIGHLLGFETEGLIRGESRPTPTLDDMRRWGMTLTFVSRGEYRALREYKQWRSLPGLDKNAYWLPEGGAVETALRGVAELVDAIDVAYDLMCCPCGTGTTLAGIVAALDFDCRAIGFAALPGRDFLERDVRQLVKQSEVSWQIVDDYHFGGFARTRPELFNFIEQFTQVTSIPLEPVYTGKMMFGIYDLIEKGIIAAGQRIVAVHTGGLQGNRGFYGRCSSQVKNSR